MHLKSWRIDMTKEKAEKILPVIQAIINGQKIQVNINNRWEDVDENHTT